MTTVSERTDGAITTSSYPDLAPITESVLSQENSDDAQIAEVAEVAGGGPEETAKAEASDTEDSDTEDSEDDSDDAVDEEAGTEGKKRSVAWSRVLAYGLLPGLALVLALTAGYFRWMAVSEGDAAAAQGETVRIASEDAVALLSYKADTAEKELGAARERLTGEFKDAYTSLTRQVVIPGAKEKHISAVAKVSAAASVSATADHAVVLLFVNQTVTVGEGGTPTDTQPVIRVTLEKVDGRWLVSHFDPV